MAIQKVTGGLLFFYGTGARGLTLRTNKLMATFNLGDTGSFSIPGGPRTAGAVIDISGNLAGDQTLRFGPACFGGTNYPKLWYEGSLQFVAAPITVPAASSQPVAVLAGFKFDGTLKAYLADNSSGGGGPAIFDATLKGKGTASAFFGASYAAGGASVRDVVAQSYTFASP